MKLSEIKNHLAQRENLSFRLPDGTFVPPNFHVTEVGIVAKNFIDCGGTIRKEKVVNFQLWEDSTDEDHRLKAGKLLKIIELSEKVLEMDDLEIEIEYQDRTIGKYDLGFDGANFELLNKKTACLAQDQCGVPKDKQKTKPVAVGNAPCCVPDGNCC